MKMNKMNSTYKNGTYHIGRINMWGSYCPETGEYYLARPEGVMASVQYIYICDDVDEMKLQVQAYSGYSYEVVRQLLQLGHLTNKTLALFIEEEGGEVWWDQPNYPGGMQNETDR